MRFDSRGLATFAWAHSRLRTGSPYPAESLQRICCRTGPNSRAELFKETELDEDLITEFLLVARFARTLFLNPPAHPFAHLLNIDSPSATDAKAWETRIRFASKHLVNSLLGNSEILRYFADRHHLRGRLAQGELRPEAGDLRRWTPVGLGPDRAGTLPSCRLEKYSHYSKATRPPSRHWRGSEMQPPETVFP